jgi:hypothetical protein
MYVLICHGNGKADGCYACSGRKSSYTSDIRKADRFSSLEEALRNACGNESAVESQLMDLC